MKSLFKKLDPLSKYEDLRVESCISLENAFNLWCIYLERVKNTIKEIIVSNWLCKKELFNIRIIQ